MQGLTGAQLPRREACTVTHRVRVYGAVEQAMDSGSYSWALALSPHGSPDYQAQGSFQLVTVGTGSQTCGGEDRVISSLWDLLPGEALSWSLVWPELQPLLRFSPS